MIAQALGRGGPDPQGAKSGGVITASGATSASGWDFCACALEADGLPDVAVCVRLAEVCAHMRACDFDAAERTLQVIPKHPLDTAAMCALPKAGAEYNERSACVHLPKCKTYRLGTPVY